MLVGELGYESLRGSDSYAFRFDEKWLAKFGSLFLCADINNYPGPQYTQPDKDIFGCFSDALPDRWGRLLLNRRESSRPKRTCCLPVTNTTSCYPKDLTEQTRAEDGTSHLL